VELSAADGGVEAGAALACGCTIVLKLAEQTPLSGLRLAQVLNEAGLRRAWST